MDMGKGRGLRALVVGSALGLVVALSGCASWTERLAQWEWPIHNVQRNAAGEASVSALPWVGREAVRWKFDLADSPAAHQPVLSGGGLDGRR